MKYTVNYQYMPTGSVRPSDDGMTVEITVDEAGFCLLPHVGDYVSLDGAEERGFEKFSGRVKSRAFFYHSLTNKKDDICNVNIVVEEVDPKIWASLLKE